MGKQQYLDVFEREHQTTIRVLRAYPADKLDLKPHAMCKNAKDLAWMFVLEQRMGQALLTTGIDPAKMTAPPPAPESMDAVIAAIDQAHNDTVRLVDGMTDDQLRETTKFFVAPKTLGDIRKIDVLWMLLHDQIHHRGQFSIYLRMAGGKVPSIYGPTADEPWT
jgi:uncharacterized damage-inducible protein DinB